MAGVTLADPSARTGRIDVGMLPTGTQGGAVASRPMSGNGEVDDRRDGFFPTDAGARTVSGIEGDARIGLTFAGAAGLPGGPPLFVAVAGRAESIRDEARAAHRTCDLGRWFEPRADAPGVVLIRVEAHRVRHRNGSDEGEVAP